MTMTYGAYVAELMFDEDADHFRGRVTNLERDGLDFCGRSVDELREEFATSVQIYEESCRAAGREPETPKAVEVT